MTFSALTHKSWTDLTRRRARSVFAVSTLAIAVASVGIFAISPLMDRAMNREVRASKLYDVQLSMSPVKSLPPMCARSVRCPMCVQSWLVRGS